MKGWGWLALLLGVLLGTTWARRSQDLHCGACRALVDELEWEIARVDPKKTIQMGSFRINPDGSQSVVEVPYARSEAHLTELLEEICDRMKEYGEQIDPSTHRKNYVRVVGRNGGSSELDLQGIRIDSDISGTLKFAVSYGCAVSSWFLGVHRDSWAQIGSRRRIWCCMLVTRAVEEQWLEDWH
ncbi:protein canopy homolog 2 isoform X1 [Rattus norvegicus]|uniref:protein canopy homolog 2 isoform X1 n=1 Tax=Rattus norvegicus TaxID=10116 RepID=UPI002645477F